MGITFEPDMRYGSSTQGMQIITNIRPNSPADKSELRHPQPPSGSYWILPPLARLLARSLARSPLLTLTHMPTVSNTDVRRVFVHY